MLGVDVQEDGGAVEFEAEAPGAGGWVCVRHCFCVVLGLWLLRGGVRRLSSMLGNVWSVFERRQDVPVGVPGSKLLGAFTANIFTQYSHFHFTFENAYHV